MPVSVGELLAYLRLDSSGFDRGIGVAQREMRTTAGAADRMSEAVGVTSERLAGAGREAQVAATGSAKYRAAQLSLVSAQERYNTALNSGKTNVARLAASEAALIRAQERVNAASTTTPGLMQRSATGMASAARSALGLGAAFGAFELAKKAIDIGKETAGFQKSMLLIQTNANASASEVKNMTDAVLTLSPQVATKPLDLANALYHVEQNGLRGKQALEALTVGAQGAKIGMADVEDTTNTMTIALASGIRGVKNMQQAMGFMIAAAGTGDMHLKDLNEALSGGILATAKGFGASLRDVAAVLATLGDNGTRGADAATALRQTLMGFAAPAAKGKQALADIGLSMTSLRDDMEKNGLVHAMNDLNQHMVAAGITGSKVGGFITDAFGRKAGAGIGVLMGEMGKLNIKFAESQKGAAGFAAKWDATTHTASFAFQKIGAEFEATGIRIATKALPTITHLGQDLGVFLPAAIHAASGVLAPFGTAWELLSVTLGAVGSTLHGIGSVLNAIGPEIKLVGGLAAGMWLGFKAGELAVAAIALVQRAVSALPGAFATAQARVTGFWASSGAAASAATDDSAAAAEAMTSEAALMSGAADTAATSVVASGEAASVGWAGLAGPLGAAAIGVATLVSMFHSSSGASKEATEAAKAYADALKSGSKTELTDSIVKQLSDNKVPETIQALNKELGTTTVAGKQFVTAIQTGGKPLADLRAKLQGIIDSGKQYSATVGRGAQVTGGLSKPALAATKLLKDLNDQYSGLTSAAKKDLIDTKAFAGVSSSIDAVSRSTKVGSDTAKQYAGMLGIQIDKNGVAAVSAQDLAAAVSTVSNAYGSATQTGDDFLKALNTFASSGGTAADRAALIGATLKAANGDALNFVTQMNGAAVANKAFGTDVTSAAKSAKESTAAYLNGLVNLKRGTIDYSKAGAAPLVSDLNQIQSAGLAAAQAMYQHARATMSGKDAADAAYQVYSSQTRGALVDEFTKLTGNAGAAKRLADRYLGMPKQVKTLIEQEGGNPIVNVLNKIGQQLAYLTGHSWNVPVSVLVNTVENVGKGSGHGAGQRTASARAAGGGLPEGVSAVGEAGPELAVKHGPHVEILSHSQSKSFLAATGMRAPGFASGTLNPHGFLTSLGKDSQSEGYAFSQLLAIGTKAGLSSKFTKFLTMENKHIQAAITERNQLAAKLAADNQKLIDAQKLLADEKATVHDAIVGSFDVTTAGTGFDGQQPITGRNMLAQEMQAANRARAFVAAVKKLKGKIGAAYLYQLAEKGPDALPEAQALLSLNRADLKAFDAAESSLNTSGNQLGTFIGNTRFGGAVARDQRVVAADKRAVANENKLIDKLGSRLVKELEHGIEHLSHPKITVYLDGKKIATAVAVGKKKNGARN